jgi:Flp pilus assembly protein TadB
MTRTTITGPDGKVTTVVTRSGCGSGLSGCFWIVLGLFVVAAPAVYFGLVGAILAYCLEAVLLAAGIHQWVARRHRAAQ